MDCCTIRGIGPEHRRERRGLDAIITQAVLVQHANGPVLIDSGVGLADRRSPLVRMGLFWTMSTGMDLSPELAAASQLRAMGIDPFDVHDIILTHMDLDHAGGVADFPEAMIHVSQAEWDAANTRRLDPLQRGRYRPIQWRDHELWCRHPAGELTWFGITGCSHIEGYPGMVLVPLPGHSLGHCGVAMLLPNGRWILHAGDAYVTRYAVWGELPAPSRFDEWFDRNIAADPEAYERSLGHLRRIAYQHGSEVTIMCSHDPRDLELHGEVMS